MADRGAEFPSRGAALPEGLRRWLAHPATPYVMGIVGVVAFTWIASWVFAPYALPDISFDQIRLLQENARDLFVVLVAPCALLGATFPRRGLSEALLLVCFALSACVYFPYTNDDSLIFSRYAVHLAAGDGLVFNVGEHVEGVTSLAWVAVLAFFIRIGAHPVVAGKILGDLLVFIAACLLQRVVRRATGNARAAFLTALLLVCDQHLASWAGSGMDVALFLAWIAAWVASVQQDDGSDISRRTMALGIIGWFVRPEAALFIGCGLLWLWVRGPRRVEQIPRIAIIGSAFVVLVLGRWIYFERLVPNTYVAKSAMQLNDPLPWFRQVVDYFTLAFLGLGVAGLLGLRSRLGWLLPIVGVLVAHFYRAGGDVLSIRFSLFLLVPLLIGIGFVFAAIDDRRRLFAFAPLVMTAVFTKPMFSRMDAAMDREVGNEAAHEYVPGNATSSYQVDYLAAQYVREHARPGDLLVADNIGVIGYYGEIRMLDTYGLTSREVADRYASGEAVDLSEEIAELRPRWILSNPAGWMWAAPRLPQFTRGQYVEVGSWESYGWSRILLMRREEEPAL